MHAKVAQKFSWKIELCNVLVTTKPLTQHKRKKLTKQEKPINQPLLKTTEYKQTGTWDVLGSFMPKNQN